MTEPNEMNEMDAPSDGEAYTVDVLYKEMITLIREHLRSGNQPSVVLARKLRRLVMQGTLREVVETGRAQLPVGLGLFRLVRMPPRLHRRLPSGEHITTERERLRVRYTMGSELERILGYEHYNRFKPKKKGLLSGVRPKSLPDGV